MYECFQGGPEEVLVDNTSCGGFLDPLESIVSQKGMIDD